MLRKKFLIILHGLLLTSALWAQTEPNTDASIENKAAPSKSVVGTMPYSNQWAYETAGSFLYLSYNSQHMSRTSLVANQYSANFSSANSAHPAIDYFIRILRLSSLEQNNFWHNLALWGHYSLGFGVKQAKLSTDAYTLSSVSETGYLAHGTMRAGLNLCLEHFEFAWPYLGAQGIFVGYRHTASVSGAEAQGGAVGYEFVGGIHVPIFFEKRIFIFGEARYTTIVDEKAPVFANGFFGAAGVGISI